MNLEENCWNLEINCKKKYWNIPLILEILIYLLFLLNSLLIFSDFFLFFSFCSYLLIFNTFKNKWQDENFWMKTKLVSSFKKHISLKKFRNLIVSTFNVNFKNLRKNINKILFLGNHRFLSFILNSNVFEGHWRKETWNVGGINFFDGKWFNSTVTRCLWVS